MSLYTVDWEPAAEQELARIWLRSPDPNGVTAAQDQIDRLLARDPVGNGRHLSEGLYRIEVPPLAAFYTIDESQRLVKVQDVSEVP